MNLVKSKQRVADHGEVFTPSWAVEEMLDLVKEEAERIDARFLEPACGSGNFVVEILERKLKEVTRKYRKTEFDLQHYALLSLMCVYGIELLEDNVEECRNNMIEKFSEILNLSPNDGITKAARYVVSQNIVHGDALSMRTHDGKAITFAEWAYIGGGKYQRRDFRFDILTGSSAFSAKDSLFSHLGKHEIFTPSKIYAPMVIGELANLEAGEAL